MEQELLTATTVRDLGSGPILALGLGTKHIPPSAPLPCPPQRVPASGSRPSFLSLAHLPVCLSAPQAHHALLPPTSLCPSSLSRKHPPAPHWPLPGGDTFSLLVFLRVRSEPVWAEETQPCAGQRAGEIKGAAQISFRRSLGWGGSEKEARGSPRELEREPEGVRPQSTHNCPLA